MANRMAAHKSRTLSRKERDELKREEQKQSEEARRRSTRAKRILKWSLALLVAAAAVTALIWLTSPREELGQPIADQGREHIAVGATHLPYNSNPPTSGPHYVEPASWGIYQSELPDETLVHNLEHGGIWISYSDIDPATKQRIEMLAKEHPNKMIVTPRSEDDAKIVLASWRRLLKLERFDEDTVMSFIKANKNRSPEPDAM
ncbi:MAG: DUF3105 domain-containing protein [Betaproteobacteria bacterium]